MVPTGTVNAHPEPIPPLSVGGYNNPTTLPAQEHSNWPDGVCSARWTPESWERNPTNSILWRRHSTLLISAPLPPHPPTLLMSPSCCWFVCLTGDHPGDFVYADNLLTSGAGFKALVGNCEHDVCHKLFALIEVTCSYVRWSPLKPWSLFDKFPSFESPECALLMHLWLKKKEKKRKDIRVKS